MDTDEDRLEQLWREHSPAVLNYARRRTGSVEDAGDVVAEVFLTAWRSIDSLPKGHDARLWLFGVARRRLMNQTRTLARRNRLAERIIDAARIHDTEQRGAGESDTAERVREALLRLTPADRELVTLTSWDGLTPADAAAVLGIGAATARVRLHRARQRLRVHLQHLGVRTEASPSPVRGFTNAAEVI